jgi:hypothetical protein
MHNKSQIWSIDLIAAITVFTIAVIFYLIFVNNIYDYSQPNMDDLYNEALIASDTLVSSGHTDFNSSTSREISITNGKHRINITQLNNMSNMTYSSLKLHLKTKYDYLIFFENSSKDATNLTKKRFIGKSGVNSTNIEEIESPKNIISTRRFLIHDSKIVTMVMYLWE